MGAGRAGDKGGSGGVEEDGAGSSKSRMLKGSLSASSWSRMWIVRESKGVRHRVFRAELFCDSTPDCDGLLEEGTEGTFGGMEGQGGGWS